MGLSQALSAALAGVTTTQQALSVISGNVANANTPGYVEENVNLVAVATAGQQGVSVDTTGINRNLNTLLQNQLWTETSGGSYADTVAQMYQQLQQVYGSPSSSSSFSAIYSNFTTALQGLSTNPGSYSAQAQVVGSAQVLAQSLNAMTGTIQELRTQAEQGIPPTCRQPTMRSPISPRSTSNSARRRRIAPPRCSKISAIRMSRSFQS
jgi:flagellar hook-associated protein 1 FlgK